MVTQQKHISFYDQISRNKLNSIALIFIIFLVFLALGYLVSLVFYRGSIFIVMSISTVISLLYIWLTYYYSDKIALSSVGAKPADPIKYRQYHSSIEGLCIASGLPKPRLYIMENPEINAFATGRNPKNSVVCVTTGALQKLNKSELEGVLAHELSHVRNYDIRFMTLVVVMVGAISIMSQMFLRSLYYKGGGDSDNKGNAILIIIGIVLAILAPILTQLVQFAISRKREFVADAGSVQITRYPAGLISALKKIKGNQPMQVNKTTASLFIANPSGKLGALMSTHPDINERIKILEAM
ncbi:M48 family metallopeptidase [Candidatus Pacearchaeota archaeon]|nr:M48 family metallopeptidase [Candidatus Pacearchaeota archaeon]